MCMYTLSLVQSNTNSICKSYKNPVLSTIEFYMFIYQNSSLYDCAIIMIVSFSFHVNHIN